MNQETKLTSNILFPATLTGSELLCSTLSNPYLLLQQKIICSNCGIYRKLYQQKSSYFKVTSGIVMWHTIASLFFWSLGIPVVFQSSEGNEIILVLPSTILCFLNSLHLVVSPSCNPAIGLVHGCLLECSNLDFLFDWLIDLWQPGSYNLQYEWCISENVHQSTDQNNEMLCVLGRHHWTLNRFTRFVRTSVLSCV